MSFGDYSEPLTDEAGRWYTIPYNGIPAVKVHIPTSEAHTSKHVAVFWQGNVTSEALNKFLSRVFEKWGQKSIKDLTTGELADANFKEIGARSVFLGVEAATGVRLELWADGERVTHKLTPEVGLSMNYDVLRTPLMVEACGALVRDTIRWRKEVNNREVSDLMVMIRARLDDYYGSREREGA